MNKKIYYYFGAVIIFMILCITEICFAEEGEEFKITIINKSGKPYRSISLDISAAGFNGAYGSMLLGRISAEETPKVFSYKYEFLTAPLTGMGMPSSLEDCNLSLYVVAGPEDPWASILKRSFENIVKSPQLIYEDKQFQRHPGRPMQGIRVPDITIITGKTEKGIEAEFDGEEYADDADE